jgi:two-component system sensor histidine kinase KdpD
VLEPLRARRVGYPAAVLLVLATIGILKLFPGLADSSVALLLLLSVFLAAWIWESGPGALAAVLATLGFNFFFIPPVHTFTVEDPRNVVALFVFLLSGLLIGRLSALARRRLRLVEAERADLTALTRLSQAFLSDTNQESLLDVAADRLRDALGAKQVAILLADENRKLSKAASTTQADVKEEIAERVYRQGSSDAFQSELGGTDLYISIPVGVQRTGVLVARGVESSERMAEGCAVLLGLALERERFLRLARAAEETKTSERIKSTLLAALAHDLKTPIATARGAIENWVAEAGSSETSRLALEQLERLTRRIGELMEVVRLDSGVARPRREVVGCGEIVEASVSRFRDALARHSLLIDAPGADLAVHVDPGQLTEALGHGLENAARYSPPGSQIRVAVDQEESWAFLRVTDDGAGIPAEERERVFERFVRLPSSAGVQGTGLGLSIARSLVEMNGGTLRLCGAPGGGTIFEIRLPRMTG